MDWQLVIAFGNAVAAGSIAAALLLRELRSLARNALAVVMLGLAAEAVTDAFCLLATGPDGLVFWKSAGLLVTALLPSAWLLFSLTYSRGNAPEFLKRWRGVLIGTLALPLVLSILFARSLLTKYVRADAEGNWFIGLGLSGIALQAILLLSSALVLMNLERTFRTATGTMRWRIKYLMLGCGILLGARIYTSSQSILFSGTSLAFMQVKLVGDLVGYCLIGFSFLRSRLSEVDLYPSHTFLYRSLTATLAGAYLLAVGVLAKIAVAFGGGRNLPIQALIALLAVVGLAVLLMSDRLRQHLRRAVSRHLRRPLHDYRSVWILFASRTAALVTREQLCREAAKLTSETFNVLSVTVFLFDDQKNQLLFGASTSLPETAARQILQSSTDVGSAFDLRFQTEPVDLDASTAPWVIALKRLNPDHFGKGGSRVCVPLVASGQFLGLITLTDRVSGIAFSTEDFDLLKCVAGQVAASLLNIKLSDSLLRSKELEAFQTMSTFFVHDLKNTALMLSLMLQNLPVHFANPDFREDSLRSIAKTVDRINDLIAKLSLLRQGLNISPVDTDLNRMVSAVLSGLPVFSGVEMTEQLQPLPSIWMDPDQIQKVLINLILNARDAVGPVGRIRVGTSRTNGWAVLEVSDNGCGITPEFLRQSLFRPFQTTKKKGIGIGMYQSKMIVEAHSGRLEVESVVGQGTTFRLLLPCVH